jgi:hypothetical protein
MGIEMYSNISALYSRYPSSEESGQFYRILFYQTAVNNLWLSTGSYGIEMYSNISVLYSTYPLAEESGNVT